MGSEILGADVTSRDVELFEERLRSSVDVLWQLLDRPAFGEGSTTVGAELELDLVDDRQRPAPINRSVLAELIDRRVTLEIDRFNLEINTRPTTLAGKPFTELARELESALAAVRRAARSHGADVVTIGILPTFRVEDLERTALTDTRR